MISCDRCRECVPYTRQLTLSNGRIEKVCQLCLASEAAELRALRDQAPSLRKPIDSSNLRLAVIREMYEDRYMKVADIARALKISRVTAYRYVHLLQKVA